MKSKVWLSISAILMVVGIGLAAFGIAKGGTWRMRFDFKNMKLSTGSENFVDKTVKTDAFNKLVVNTETFDININQGSDYSVYYNVPDDKIPVIKNENGVLTVNAEDESGLSLFNFASYDQNPYINITIPDNDALKDFELETSTGDIRVSNLNFEGSIYTSTGDIRLSQSKTGKLQLHVSTGEIIIDDCSIQELNTEGSTGEVYILNTTVSGSYTAKTSTGDISIKYSELSSLSVDGSTSEIYVDKSKIDDVKIDTSTGDVTLDLSGEESEYSCKISTNTGDIKINGKIFEDNYNSTSGSKSINVETSTGDIVLRFNK